MALGAQRSGIARLVLQSGVVLALFGSTLGILGAFAASYIIRSLLFEVSATDPWLYAGSVLLMMLIAYLASLLPALRASSIEPIKALRSVN
jgi:putative ABC transport system permease protein